MAQVFNDSIQIHQITAIFLPTKQYSDIVTRRMGILESSKTVFEYIKEKNFLTASTGRELKIEPIPHLAGAGAGATDRMVMAEFEVKNFKFPFPIPYTFLPPDQVGREVNLYSEYKMGDIHNRWPLSMIYVDEI